MICSTLTESERTLKSGIYSYQLSAVSVRSEPALTESRGLRAARDMRSLIQDGK
jgi:hypothetical protein